MHFLTIDCDVRRRCNAQPDLAAAETHYRDNDIARNA
jgi:hypothetical protein